MSTKTKPQRAPASDPGQPAVLGNFLYPVPIRKLPTPHPIHLIPVSLLPRWAKPPGPRGMQHPPGLQGHVSPSSTAPMPLFFFPTQKGDPSPSQEPAMAALSCWKLSGSKKSVWEKGRKKDVPGCRGGSEKCAIPLPLQLDCNFLLDCFFILAAPSRKKLIDPIDLHVSIMCTNRQTPGHNKNTWRYRGVCATFVLVARNRFRWSSQLLLRSVQHTTQKWKHAIVQKEHRAYILGLLHTVEKQDYPVKKSVQRKGNMAKRD